MQRAFTIACVAATAVTVLLIGVGFIDNPVDARRDELEQQLAELTSGLPSENEAIQKLVTSRVKSHPQRQFSATVEHQL